MMYDDYDFREDQRTKKNMCTSCEKHSNTKKITSKPHILCHNSIKTQTQLNFNQTHYRRAEDLAEKNDIEITLIFIFMC